MSTVAFSSLLPVPDGALATASPAALPMVRLRLSARADTPLALPPYAGSMLRGAFGHALLALSPLPHADGKPCALHASCPYCQLFASPPLPAHSLQKFSQMPQPYVIEPPASGLRKVAAGQVFDFHMVLIGKALNWLSAITQAWRIALRKGLNGSACTLLTVQEVNRPDSTTAPIVQQQAQLHFLTPLRLQVQGKPMRDPHGLTARDVLIALARRHQLLRDVHLGAQAPQYDFSRLLIQAEAIRLSDPEMRWFEWGRYSQRQQQEMKLGGLLGSLRLSGPLAPFSELLYLGQWLHLGKNASFGLGGYTLTAPASAAASPPAPRPDSPAHQN